MNPCAARVVEAGSHAVGEEHAEEGELGEDRDHLVLGMDVDDAERTLAEHKAARQEDHRNRQHAAMSEA